MKEVRLIALQIPSCQAMALETNRNLSANTLIWEEIDILEGDPAGVWPCATPDSSPFGWEGEGLWDKPGVFKEWKRSALHTVAEYPCC